MKSILTIGHEHYLLPNNPDFVLNLSRSLEGIQRIRRDFDRRVYELEPADFSCEMLSETAFSRRFDSWPTPETDDDDTTEEVAA